MFWPIGTAFALHNFVHFAVSMVWPPAAAICDVPDFLGSCGLAAAQGPKRAKNAGNVYFPGVGGRSE